MVVAIIRYVCVVVCMISLQTMFALLMSSREWFIPQAQFVCAFALTNRTIDVQGYIYCVYMQVYTTYTYMGDAHDVD